MKRNLIYVSMFVACIAASVSMISCDNTKDSASPQGSASSRSLIPNSEASLDTIEAILRGVDPKTYRLELGQLPKNSLIKKSSYGSLSFDDIFELNKERITIEKLIRLYPPALKGCFDIYNLEKLKQILEKVSPERYKGLVIQKISKDNGILVRELDQVEKLFGEVDLRTYRLDFGKVKTNQLAKQTTYGAYPLDRLEKIYTSRGYGSQFDQDWGIDICPPYRTTIRVHKWIDFDKFKNILTEVDSRFKNTRIDEISTEEAIIVPVVKQ